MKIKNQSIKIISLIICAALVISGGFMYFNQKNLAHANTKAEKDIKKAEKESLYEALDIACAWLKIS